jgi:hypothetical protein
MGLHEWLDIGGWGYMNLWVLLLVHGGRGWGYMNWSGVEYTRIHWSDAEYARNNWSNAEYVRNNWICNRSMA